MTRCAAGTRGVVITLLLTQLLEVLKSILLLRTQVAHMGRRVLHKLSVNQVLGHDASIFQSRDGVIWE